MSSRKKLSRRPSRARISTVTPHTRPLPRINAVKQLQCIYCQHHVHFLDERCKACRIRLNESRKVQKKLKIETSRAEKMQFFVESKLQKAKEKLGRNASRV